MADLLLVEDERDARRMLTLGLERHGHRVRACADGAEALAAIDDAVEVVVSDLVMPRVDGLALLRALAERQHRARRVVITSFADKERTIAALNLGADFLLEKPFLVEDLERVLQRLLRSDPVDRLDAIFQRQLDSLGLTARERGLIVYVLKGLPNLEIARITGVSEAAVKSALHGLYRKLGIASRGELFHLIFPV